MTSVSVNLAQWLKEKQVVSGPVGRMAGPETPPMVTGEMYSKFDGSEGACSGEVIREYMFDNAMKLYLKKQGPPPCPLHFDSRDSMTAAYNSWWCRVGNRLSDQWYRDHPAKPAAKASNPKAAPKPAPKPVEEEKPRRIMVAASEQSGW
jgi:hypothetical protein